MRLIDADALIDDCKRHLNTLNPEKDWKECARIHWLIGVLENALTVQPERDIPVKPNEATDTAWGIPHRQAVCPKCDYYLGHVAFLGDYKGKKVTYCETCGQAIDWEGWDFDG